ncbi:hypothetical protein [Pseudoalteromonas sp. OOF1S-7]|uniref:hypothetical protein n=1 Tax=Pseudoalteromonas sp. OOF1S-7 TaxID=2917757 RepID=UPI001EF718AC|nr:hypothetical protein [Pseudoalteromonas sp. OOF1S-7]MCG7533692.1 hypothetical protein [Pseudoalteromonas sp. OOF1S-7]
MLRKMAADGGLYISICYIGWGDGMEQVKVGYFNRSQSGLNGNKKGAMMSAFLDYLKLS